MKFLLIQFRTDKSGPHEQRCVKVHAELEDHQLTIVNPLTDPQLVDNVTLEQYDAVIVGGSGEFNLSHPTSELENALAIVKPLIDAALRHDMPFLGMCFGHQLLSQHLGGRVDVNSTGPKAGTYTVRLTQEGKEDPIKAGVPDVFSAQHGHKDSVVELPHGAVVLSQSDHDPHASFRIKGKNTYSIQYHPELDQDDLIFRILLYPSYAKGKTEEDLRREYRPTPHAPQMLKNFRTVVHDYMSKQGRLPKTAPLDGYDAGIVPGIA